MINDIIKSSIINIWPSFAIVAVIVISIRIAYLMHHHIHFKLYEELWKLISILYVMLLFELVTRLDLNNYASGINLIPFKEITRYDLTSKMFYFNVIGNILLFVPLGLIICNYVKPKKCWTNIILGLIICLSIETIQLYIGRSFDVDDIILNVIGVLFGYLFYHYVHKFSKILPNFVKSTWFINLICIIIITCVILYIYKMWGGCI